ncbi:MAG: hypothetical protein ACK5XZ_03280 [Hyphomonadaceae bacterium]|jgi:hypothetical protein
MLTLAGIIVFLYAVSSILGLWLASQVTKMLEGEGPIPEALAETPQHHLDLMANYAMGWRASAWRTSIGALVTSLVALAFSSSLAFWALGLALAIDCILFMTCRDIRLILYKTTAMERLVDAAQCVALLASFTLFFWLTLTGALA